MERRNQTLEEVLNSLSPLETGWEDETSKRAIETLESLPVRSVYTLDDVGDLLKTDFDIGILVVRLFLGLSKDDMETNLAEVLGSGIGVKRFQADSKKYLEVLENMGLLDTMAEAINYKPKWSDIFVERLRSMRGRAIRGQKRGRGLEDYVEGIVQDVFGKGGYEIRCKFAGANGETAKCDFAIPTRKEARILIEAKGYGATGSKMTDVIGDLNIIVGEKRHDTTLIFFTDGVTWRRRTADLEKIVAMQNRGQISRIYTTKMAEAFKKDLQTLQQEHAL